MPGLILQAPQFVDVKGPLIYLAGPIQGTWDWRAEAIAHLHQKNEHIHIANPKARRFTGEFGAHINWCERYQEKAAENGALLFWLPAETKHRVNRSYAQDARFELGQFLARSWGEGIKLVVGFEKGFTGAYYLRDKLSRHYGNVPVCRTLKQACIAAVELATNRSTRWAEIREKLI